MTSEGLAMKAMGLRDGSRLSILGARSRGFDSLRVQQCEIGPTGSANYPWGTSSGRSQEDGVSRPTVILAHALEESKGRYDVPQLPNRL